MRIGYATQNPSSHYWLLVNYGVRERATERGIDLTTTTASTLEQQITAIDAFIAARVDVLLLGPVVANGLADPLERARAARIPVIVLAAQLREGAVDCTVRSDHRAGAEMAAAYLVEQIAGSGAVAHLIGPRQLQDNVDRALGVRHVLGLHPRVALAFEQESPDWLPESGAALMRAALEHAPHLRGVCVANDTLALGALTAIEAVGRTGDIVVTGFDATPDALVAIHEGRMSATISQSMRRIGHTAVDMACRVAGGETVPSLVLADIALITRANLLDTALETVYFLPSVLCDVVERGEALERARTLQIISERQQAERDLRASDDRFRLLADASFEGIVVADAGKIVEVNQAWLRMFGYDAAEVRGMEVLSLTTPESGPLARAHIASGSDQPYEVLVRRKDGTIFPVEARSRTMQSDGRTLRITAVQDITERKTAEAERERLLGHVQRALARTAALYHTAQALITVSDVPQLLQTVVNDAAAVLPADRVTAITVDLDRRQVLQFVPGGPGAGDVQVVAFDEVWNGLSGWVLREGRSTGSATADLDPRESPDVQRRREETNCGAIMVVPLHFHRTTLGTVTLINRRDQPDFTPDDLALLEALANQAAAAISNVHLVSEMQRLAVTDELTQVLNRRGFFLLAHREMGRARRHHEMLAAIMLDIDHFKHINDHYGHATGDHVLRTVAQRCRDTLREVDVFGRYGGEEFAILLPMTPRRGAQVIAERLRARMATAPVETAQGPIAVTVSLGVAVLDGDMPDLAALLQRADAAVYAAKHAGRNQVAVDGRGRDAVVS